MAYKVLLTGAAGLIGRSVARRLAGAGVAYVGIDKVGAVIDGRDVLRCDIRDVAMLQAVAREAGFSAIVHCGAYSGPMFGIDDPASVIAVNVGGTANLLDLARTHGIRRLVFCSSVSAAGPTDRPVDERAPLRPSTIYGATKAACEALITTYGQVFGIETVCLRFSAVRGPHRQTVCSLGTMIRDAVARRPTRIAQGADFPTQYLHVDDAAEIIFSALGTPEIKQPAYFVTGGDTIPLSEIGHRVQTILPHADIEIGPGPDPIFEWQEEFDISAVRRDFAFDPKTRFNEGVMAFVHSINDSRR